MANVNPTHVLVYTKDKYTAHDFSNSDVTMQFVEALIKMHNNSIELRMIEVCVTEMVFGLPNQVVVERILFVPDRFGAYQRHTIG